MLSKEDLHNIGQMMDKRFFKFEGRFVKLEERFEALEQKFIEFRQEIKDDILQFKLDIVSGYDKVQTEFEIVKGYRQMIEDCQEQIDKLKGPRTIKGGLC